MNYNALFKDPQVGSSKTYLLFTKYILIQISIKV